MIKLKLFLCLLVTALSLASVPAIAAPPPRAVAFYCGSGVEIHCAIPRLANPEFSTQCWYVAGGQRFLMRSEGPWRFSVGPVRMRLIDGMPMTAGVRNFETGFRAFCSEE